MNFEKKGQPIFKIVQKKNIDPELDIKEPICPYCYKEFGSLSSTKKHISNLTCKKLDKDREVYASLNENHINEQTFYEIEVKNNEKIQIIPQNTERSIFNITGQSGSGKSFFTARVVNEYHLKYKKRKIYLFSALQEDPTLDKAGLPINRVKLDENFLNTPISIAEFKNTIIIVDDADVISNKKIKEKLFKLLDALLQIGRHYNTTVFVCNHAPNRGKDTKILLLESNWFVIFPKTSGNSSIKYLMENYVGLNSKQIGKLKKLNSRWVAIYRSYPQVVVYEKGAYILNENGN